MSSSPALLDPADLVRQRAGDAEYYREVLHRLIAMGTDLAGAIHRQATAEPSTAPAQEEPQRRPRQPVSDLAVAFDRVARTIRRTVVLARKLSEPERASAAREHPLRAIESTARRRPHRGGTGPLRAELLDRLDAPDPDDAPDDAFDGDLDGPLESFIAGIRRDLGRAVPPGVPIWKPRTPQDVWDLCVRAAQLSAAEPHPGSGTPSAAPRPIGTETDTGPPEP